MRRVFISILAAVLICGCAACAGRTADSTADPPSSDISPPEVSEQYGEPAEYTNSAFGVTVRVPRGWAASVNEENLLPAVPDPQNVDSGGADSVELGSGGLGFSLCELENFGGSANRSHISFTLFIETFDGATLDEYSEALQTAFCGEFGEYSSEYLGSAAADKDGRDSRIIDIVTTTPERAEYTERYLVTPLDGGAFVVACATWWNTNPDGERAANTALAECYSIALSPVG